MVSKKETIFYSRGLNTQVITFKFKEWPSFVFTIICRTLLQYSCGSCEQESCPRFLMSHFPWNCNSNFLEKWCIRVQIHKMSTLEIFNQSTLMLKKPTWMKIKPNNFKSTILDFKFYLFLALSFTYPALVLQENGPLDTSFMGLLCDQSITSKEKLFCFRRKQNPEALIFPNFISSFTCHVIFQRSFQMKSLFEKSDTCSNEPENSVVYIYFLFMMLNGALQQKHKIIWSCILPLGLQAGIPNMFLVMGRDCGISL